MSMRRVIQAMINTDYSNGDGSGKTIPLEELVYLDTSKRVRKALGKAKKVIVIPVCGDVSQIKLEQIDKGKTFSINREIARVCKQMFTIKAPHGKRRWGVSVTPAIEVMLKNKTHELIDSIYDNSEKFAKYSKQAGFVKIGFSHFVGHLVAVAIQILPSSKEEFERIYLDIWAKRERDKTYRINRNPKAREKLHRQCLKTVKNLKDDLPISSLTWMEPSGLAEIQKLHWRSSFQSLEISSISQRRNFIALINIKKMKKGRNDEESKHLNELIKQFIENIEISTYWLTLLNNEFQVYQQMTCLDWCRLEGKSTLKMNQLIDEMSEYVGGNSEVHLRIAFLRLLLPLVEPWILCILLKRKLKKASISRHISAGLKELKEHIEYIRPDLLKTFNQLKQYTRPYGKGGVE